MFLISGQIELLPKSMMYAFLGHFKFFFLITEISFNVVDGESQVSKELFH